MKNKKIFYINLIYYIAMFMVAIIFVCGYAGLMKNNVLTSLLLQIVIIAGIPLLLYSLLVSRSIKQTLKDFGFKKLGGKLLVISILIAIVLFLLNIFIADCFASVLVLLGYENSLGTLSVSGGNMLQSFLLTACLPGLCEEILHRGMMLNGCKKQGFTRYALITSSILFGLMHLNIVQFFYATILGLCIGISVIATGSIWTGIIAHFTNNFLSVYFSYDLNLPSHKLYDYIAKLFMSMNYPALIFTVCVIVFLLVGCFMFLIRLVYKIKANERIAQIKNELIKSNYDEAELDDKIVELSALVRLNYAPFNEIKVKKRPMFTEKIFLYASLSLGILATITSFIVNIL